MQSQRLSKHAILVARHLSIKYLWIDTLCIIQDSVEDWHAESALMGHIYSNAYCNISATAAANSSQGLFLKRDVCERQQNRAFLTIDSVKSLYSFKEDLFWRVNVSNAPLNQRAWVFQENLLSPRNIHFGTKEVYWEYCEFSTCETEPNNIYPGIQGTSIKDRFQKLLKVNEDPTMRSEQTYELWWEHWWELIETYATMSLTHQTDRLIVISGIASHFQPKVSGKYLAGIWSHNLPRDLLWRAKAPGLRSDDYIGPTWSWAACISSTASPKRSVQSPEICMIERYSCDIVPVGENMFGQIKSGLLELHGLLATAVVPIGRQTCELQVQTVAESLKRLIGVDLDYQEDVDSLTPGDL